MDTQDIYYSAVPTALGSKGIGSKLCSRCWGTDCSHIDGARSSGTPGGGPAPATKLGLRARKSRSKFSKRPDLYN